MATIVRGSDCSFKAICKFSNKIPLDLTSVTDIVVSFIDENEAVVTVTKIGGFVTIVEPKGAGVIAVNLTKAFTQSLMLGERLDMMFTFITGSVEKVAVVPGILEVIPKLGQN